MVFKTFNTNLRGMRLKLKKICLMDIRAFGSYYGQSATLPYGSGYHIVTSGNMARVNFPACRGILVEHLSGVNSSRVTLVLTDSQGQVTPFEHITSSTLLPFSCTAVVSGTSAHCVVLY